MPSMMSEIFAAVAAIERATLAAVPPDAVEETGGWLIALDPGTVGRAHSAVPLLHEAPAPGQWRDIEARYRTHGLPPVFRLPEAACFDAMRRDLAVHGYAAHQPTVVKTGDVGTLAGLVDARGVRLSASVDDAAAAVFLGEGFDPVDGAHRVRLLRRATSAVHASVSHDGQVVAVGSAGFGHGWAGIHGMRTRAPYRGRGYARQILAALGQAALSRGIHHVFLQVEATGLARPLYRRAGFSAAWTYAYWRHSSRGIV